MIEICSVHHCMYLYEIYSSVRMCVNCSYCSWDGGVYSAGFSEYGWWRGGKKKKENRKA